MKKSGTDYLIFDAHCDTANSLLKDSYFFKPEEKRHLDIKKAKKGGLKAQIFAIWVNPLYPIGESEKKALRLYQALDEKMFKNDYVKKVTSISQMNKALNEKKLAGWIFLEGGHIIENSLDILKSFYQMGIRGMTLVHTKNTDWADSSGDKPKWNGLNALGKKIVLKMNEMNMIIDVSHSSDKTVENVLEISNKPIIASHSCSRKLCNIPRNLPDNLIKEIAESGGYIGVNFFPGFLEKKIFDILMKNLKKYEKWYESEKTKHEKNPEILDKLEIDLYKKMAVGIDKINSQSLIKHISHIADIGGIDCIGLGSDFDGIPTTPTDLTDVSCYPNLINGLYDNGFKNEEIEKIMGLNLYNYFKRNEELL